MHVQIRNYYGIDPNEAICIVSGVQNEFGGYDAVSELYSGDPRLLARAIAHAFPTNDAPGILLLPLGAKDRAFAPVALFDRGVRHA